MRLDDLLRVSLRQVLCRHLRGLWVVAAIALGTAGFIVIVTVGQDIKELFNQDLEILGRATVIQVKLEGHPNNPLISMPQWFRQTTVAALRRMTKVIGVSLIAWRGHTYSKKGQRPHFYQLLGVDRFYWETNDFSPLTGRFFSPDEVTGHKRVCVLGTEMARRVFGHFQVAGYLMNIDNDYYRVIGVVEQIGIGDVNNRIFIPLTTAQDRIRGLGPIDTLYIRCYSWDDVENVATAIPSVVKAYQSAEGLSIRVAWDLLKKIKKMAWWIETFVNLSVIATLVLGGFGIWNIMTNSVRYRTREIGLKKAMGAKDRDILAQFLAEALCLSLTGALGGIALGRGVMEFMCLLLDISPAEDLFLLCVGIGFFFAILMGIGAGLSPAVRASRMEVVTAVRYE